MPGKLLNQTPVSDTNFDDTFFEFDKPHFYFVRTVSVGTGGEPVESNAQLVERTVRIARELDRRPATPDEAREQFALRGRVSGATPA